MDRNDTEHDITLTDTIQFENKFTPTKEMHLDYLKAKASNNKVTKFAMPLLLFYYVLWYPFLIEGLQYSQFRYTYLGVIIISLAFTVIAYIPNLKYFYWILDGKKPFKNLQFIITLQFGEQSITETIVNNRTEKVTLFYRDIKSIVHYHSKINSYTFIVFKNNLRLIVVHSGFYHSCDKDFIDFIEEKTNHCKQTEKDKKSVRNSRVIGIIVLTTLPILYYIGFVWLTKML